jgi:hypothetical protein
MSLIDTEDWIDNETDYTSKSFFSLRDTSITVEPGRNAIARIPLQHIPANSYLKITLDGVTQEGLWQSYLTSNIALKDSCDERKIRLFNNLNKEKDSTQVAYYHKISEAIDSSEVTLSIVNDMHHSSHIGNLSILLFTEKK